MSETLDNRPAQPEAPEKVLQSPQESNATLQAKMDDLARALSDVEEQVKQFDAQGFLSPQGRVSSLDKIGSIRRKMNDFQKENDASTVASIEKNLRPAEQLWRERSADLETLSTLVARYDDVAQECSAIVKVFPEDDALRQNISTAVRTGNDALQSTLLTNLDEANIDSSVQQLRKGIAFWEGKKEEVIAKIYATSRFQLPDRNEKIGTQNVGPPVSELSKTVRAPDQTETLVISLVTPFHDDQNGQLTCNVASDIGSTATGNLVLSRLYEKGSPLTLDVKGMKLIPGLTLQEGKKHPESIRKILDQRLDANPENAKRILHEVQVALDAESSTILPPDEHLAASLAPDIKAHFVDGHFEQRNFAQSINRLWKSYFDDLYESPVLTVYIENGKWKPSLKLQAGKKHPDVVQNILNEDFDATPEKFSELYWLLVQAFEREAVLQDESTRFAPTSNDPVELAKDQIYEDTSFFFADKDPYKRKWETFEEISKRVLKDWKPGDKRRDASKQYTENTDRSALFGNIEDCLEPAARSRFRDLYSNKFLRLEVTVDRTLIPELTLNPYKENPESVKAILNKNPPLPATPYYAKLIVRKLVEALNAEAKTPMEQRPMEKMPDAERTYVISHEKGFFLSFEKPTTNITTTMTEPAKKFLSEHYSSPYFRLGVKEGKLEPEIDLKPGKEHPPSVQKILDERPAATIENAKNIVQSVIEAFEEEARKA